jgi:K+-transporting ATPase ATPase C chain|uniref:Potassium-transporting ATPase KdpC subunit n=1 Tax=Desulfobacca acetoxidans TaxID=60893 RepID=A0A7V6DNW1_9BACT
MTLRELWREVRRAALIMLGLLIILCGLYPLAVWGVAQVAFPDRANGSLVKARGQVVGSRLLAQNFAGPHYFHPRPSAAGATGYDGASSGGSNLGPLSRQLIEQVKERVENYRTENNLPAGTLIPADAVTASGSGLDPHISLRNAGLQAGRVARARNLREDQVAALIKHYTEGRGWGFLGEAGVNVLQLNLALDALTGKQ